jgi:hypothetical protein
MLPLAFFLLFALPLLSVRANPVDFAGDVRPLFEKNCLKFHGPEKQKIG